MKPKKPKLIMEQYFNSNCIHLMVSINNKEQVKYLLNFCNRFINNNKNKKILKIDFNDVFKYYDKTFSSHRLVGEKYSMSYLVIDEGKKSNTAFIYIVVNSTKEYFKKVKSYWVENYFEL